MEENLKKNQIIKENRKEMLFNLIIAGIIVLYFIILIFGKINIEAGKFETDLQVLTMTLLAVTIIIFEKSYKKDSGKLAITGIEFLVISCHILSITYITKLFNFQFKEYIIASAGIIVAYYLLKILIIYTIGKKKYLNSLSDIAEIVKEEEPVKKEAFKRKKEEDKEEKKTEEKVEEKVKVKEKKAEGKVKEEKEEKAKSKKEKKTKKNEKQQ